MHGEKSLQGFGWENNIKMDLRKMIIDGVNWTQQAQDRVQW